MRCYLLICWASPILISTPCDNRKCLGFSRGRLCCEQLRLHQSQLAIAYSRCRFSDHIADYLYIHRLYM
jgi:hypothetical protein